jgi:hypothetical protein
MRRFLRKFYRHEVVDEIEHRGKKTGKEDDGFFFSAAVPDMINDIVGIITDKQ